VILQVFTVIFLQSYLYSTLILITLWRLSELLNPYYSALDGSLSVSVLYTRFIFLVLPEGAAASEKYVGQINIWFGQL